jgi:dTDP-4-dehydrorhamnose reductase
MPAGRNFRSMRVLIVGASGQVGSKLYEIHNLNLHKVQGTTFSYEDKLFTKLDIRNKLEVLNFITSAPDIVHLPAAQCNVDWCESNPDEAWKVNVVGVDNVLFALNKYKEWAKKEPRLIFYSTDFVFDGTEGLYDENSIPAPINRYGEQKLIAENLIMQRWQNHIIIRTNVVYGEENLFGSKMQGKNFILRMIERLRKKEKVLGIVNEWGTPTYNLDLAKLAYERSIDSNSNGIYHIGGADAINRYKLALKAAEIFGEDASLIHPISSESLKRAARRPLNAGLKSIRNDLGPAPRGYLKGLEDMYEKFS